MGDSRSWAPADAAVPHLRRLQVSARVRARHAARLQVHIRLISVVRATLYCAEPAYGLVLRWGGGCQDGRWTLAFADEARALAAKRLLDGEAVALQHAARGALTPLLHLGSGSCK